MMRLGARDDTQEVVIAPDFSISAYMLEEYITLAAASLPFPAAFPSPRDLRTSLISCESVSGLLTMPLKEKR